ncbi:MAG: Gfo/Idh/MocA family oxidoreductase [Candidatus Latescibacterota bacterium]
MLPRIAVVGMGGFARTHLQAAAELEAAGLARQVAQVAIEADRQAFGDQLKALARREVAVYGSLRELLAAARREIDLVVIPTGIALHRPMTEAALEAGCHVLVEKPAAGSIQDVDAMLAAQARSGRLCAVGYQHLCRDDVARVKEWVCSGRLGRVRQVRAAGCWPRDPAYYRRNGWAGKVAVGDAWVLDSPHQNALAHAVNLMCYLGCDRPGEALIPATVQAELYRANEIESADTAVFRLISTEGVEVFFAVSHAVDRSVDPVVVLTGDRGVVELEYQGGGRAHWREGGVEELPVLPGRGVLADLCEAIIGRRSGPACPLSMARAQSLCVCGTFESSAVHEVPASERRVRAESGQVWVRGMTELVLRAGGEAALFSELEVPWAIAGERLDLAGYAYLPTWRVPPG